MLLIFLFSIVSEFGSRLKKDITVDVVVVAELKQFVQYTSSLV